MDFPELFVRGLGGQEISRWDAKSIRPLGRDEEEAFQKIVDEFGKRSAIAQSLPAPITNIFRLRSTDQVLYLQADRVRSGTILYGGIKVGKKKLFIRWADASIHEIEPLCVLDFYVHESCQRKGVGKALFEHMLAQERVDPASLAYDRPSPKLIAFLRRHYGLKDYVPQGNNYVVFDQYFTLNPNASRQARRLDSWGGQSKLPPAGKSSARSSSVTRSPACSNQVVPPWGTSPTLSTSAPGNSMPLQQVNKNVVAPVLELQNSQNLNPQYQAGGSGMGPQNDGGHRSGWGADVSSNSQMRCWPDSYAPPSRPDSGHPTTYSSPTGPSWNSPGVPRSPYPHEAQIQIASTPTHAPGVTQYACQNLSTPPMRSMSLDRSLGGRHVDALDNFKLDFVTRPPSGPGSASRQQLVPPWASDVNPSGSRPTNSVHQTTPPWGTDASAGPSYRHEQQPQIGRRISSPSPYSQQSPSTHHPGGHSQWPGQSGSAYTPDRAAAGQAAGSNTGGLTPRQAAVRQRSGSGAAGCMVW